MGSSFYSGYQLFIQSFGAQTLQPASTPAFTIQTELIVEFMQPAFQNTASSFTSRIFDVKLTVIPDGSKPDETRDYIFERVIVEPNDSGEREYKVLLKRADGQPGNITYTSGELLQVYEQGKSGNTSVTEELFTPDLFQNSLEFLIQNNLYQQIICLGITI